MTEKKHAYKKPAAETTANLDAAAPVVETPPTVALAVPQAAPLAVRIEGVIHNRPAGFEDAEPGDLMIPRLAVVQSMSKCVDHTNPNAPKIGQFYDSITLDAYDAPITGLVPIIAKKARIKFAAVQGQPWECRSLDGKTGNVYGDCSKCEFPCWGPNGEKPLCTESRDFYCVRASDPDPSPFLISFMKSSFQAGKKWYSNALIRAGATGSVLFDYSYTLNREQVKNDKGTFFVLKVSPEGRVSDPRRYEPIYRGLYSAFAAGTIAIHDNNDDGGTPF